MAGISRWSGKWSGISKAIDRFVRHEGLVIMYVLDGFKANDNKPFERF